MTNAVRVISVERGRDVRDFTLVAYGGAGPTHAAEIARELAIPRVLVPPFPGCTSAFGAVISGSRRDFLRTVGPDRRPHRRRRRSRASTTSCATPRDRVGRRGVRDRRDRGPDVARRALRGSGARVERRARRRPAGRGGRSPARSPPSTAAPPALRPRVRRRRRRDRQPARQGPGRRAAAGHVVGLGSGRSASAAGSSRRGACTWDPAKASSTPRCDA